MAVVALFVAWRNFNPPSPCGEGQCFLSGLILYLYFNPPSPCGEGHLPFLNALDNIDFNPPSPCGEGHGYRFLVENQPGISIHPPRVGRDPEQSRDSCGGIDISIHPPRVGRDCRYHSGTLRPDHFNPPSPCGEGQIGGGFTCAKLGGFQSTLPVWGGTGCSFCSPF